MNEKIVITRRKEKIRNVSIVVVLVVLFVISVVHLNLNVSQFIKRFDSAGDVVIKFLNVDFSAIETIMEELFISLCMAIAGLAIGFTFSLVLAFLGAKNTAPHPIVSGIVKGFVSIIRAVPALVWILVVVASLGFGNTSGVVGLVFPTTGYLTKSFISSIEEQEAGIIESLQASGASWFQVISKGLLVELVVPFLSWTSIRLEANIAESISLGMVGAGGIGMFLMKAIGRYDYATISTVILCIFVTMFIIEMAVNQIKKSIR